MRGFGVLERRGAYSKESDLYAKSALLGRRYINLRYVKYLLTLFIYLYHSLLGVWNWLMTLKLSLK